MPTPADRTPVNELRPRLKILYAGPECWSVRWDEPLAPADPRQWGDYLRHAEDVLLPLLRQHFPAWQATRRTPRPVTMRAQVYGVIRSIPESTVLDFIRVFLLAFPAAVLTGHRLERFDYLAPTEDDQAAANGRGRVSRGQGGEVDRRAPGAAMLARLVVGFRWGADISEWTWASTTEVLALVGLPAPTRPDLAAGGLALKELSGGRMKFGRARSRFYLVAPPVSGASIG